MVLRGLDQERGAVPATSPKRSNRLHNFSLPFLKWGTQRHLRCTNSPDGAGTGASCSGEHRFRRKQEENPVMGSKRRVVDDGYDEDGGIAVVRQKLMLDLKTAADRMKDAILRKQEEEAGRPWNLRTRQAECKAPVSAAGEKKQDCSSPARTDGTVKLPNLRSNFEKTRRVKFSVQLSRKEVEEDFMEMVGRRPPRRPNKRPKVVQKKLDTLIPGLWLTEVTADSYKVLEATAKGKGKAKDASP